MDVPWGSLRVLGGPWGGPPLIDPGGSWGSTEASGGIGRDRGGSERIKASLGRGSDAPKGALDRLRTRPDRLRTHPDVSPNATRSSLDRPKGPRSAQGRPKASNMSPKIVQEMFMVPGGPWEGLGGPQNRRFFFKASQEGPGKPLGWFWCSEVVFGSVLGSPNVAISLIIMMF